MSVEDHGNVGPPSAEEAPSKQCPDAREFIVHVPHTWHKPNRPAWLLWCDGILPVDQQPPCQAYVSPTQPECGKPAPTTIRIKTKLIDATIDVCADHKRGYDNRAAANRMTRNTLPKAS